MTTWRCRWRFWHSGQQSTFKRCHQHVQIVNFKSPTSMSSLHFLRSCWTNLSQKNCLIGININLCVPFGKMIKLHHGWEFSQKDSDIIEMENDINTDSSGKLWSNFHLVANYHRRQSPKSQFRTYMTGNWLLRYKLLFSKRR